MLEKKDKLLEINKNLVWKNFRFLKFRSGDILSVYYKVNGLGFNFTGICISLNKKKLKNANSSFLLKNMVIGIYIECNFSLYAIFKLNYWILNFAKKQLFYRKAKLYFLRDHINKASFIKW